MDNNAGGKMKYTPAGEKVDREIQKYVDIAVEEILKKVPDALSIIIYGGYGRGEGSYFLKKGKVMPVNDFDTYVITEKPAEPEVLDAAADNFAKRLGIKGIPFKSFDKTWNFDQNFYLDLKCLTTSQLKKLFPMIRYYELRNATNVVYGKDTRTFIPDFKKSDVPLSEGARILMNRMTHLVEYFSTEGKHDPLTLSFFCTKAFIDSCTALSLLSKRYEPSYLRRMDNFVKNYEKDFPELAKKLPDLPKKVKKYTEWKMKINGLPEKNIEKLWLDARHNITEVAKYFVGRMLGKRIETLDELSDAIASMGKTYYRPYAEHFSKTNLKIRNNLITSVLSLGIHWYFKVLYFLRILKNKRPYLRIFTNKSAPDLQIMAAMVHILHSLDRHMKIDSKNFSKGLNELRKVYPAKAIKWEDLSQEYADAYVLFYLQKIV